MNSEFENVLRSTYKNYDYIVMNKVPKKPKITNFFNSDEAIELLKTHIDRGSKIAIHADVDLDGIGSAYIMNRFLIKEMRSRPYLLINNVKRHGITEAYVEPLTKLGIELLIIVDSSSNNYETIEKFECDVLVIDHHIVDTMVYSGKTQSGRYYIVNNTVPNFDVYEPDYAFSAGMVVYEFLRAYLDKLGKEDWMFEAKLYQWAVLTLFTDIISMDSERNQYYANYTIFNMNIEPALCVLLRSFSKYMTSVSKSVILFKLGPYVNQAIRAGACKEVLAIFMNNPANILELDKDGKYSELQAEALEFAETAVVGDCYGYADMTNSNIKSSYSGVIAAGILNKTEKSAVAFKEKNGICKGSFRGKYQLNYKDMFSSYCMDKDHTFAQGHANVFGFALHRETLMSILTNLKDIEKNYKDMWLITAGNMPQDYRGKYHIDNLALFAKSLGLANIGLMNRKLVSTEDISLYVMNSSDVIYKKREVKRVIKENADDSKHKKSKKDVYDVSLYGIRAIAFEPLTSDILKVYVEFSEKLDVFVSNYTNLNGRREINET